ncbi:MAG: hypothetical protein CBC42_01510 [Betaproteobacteria bacterium TMED82]|nr:MAG: hypothetical protein CBC42_01510 [Betaproteobacteria bacterium TMED82]
MSQLQKQLFLYCLVLSFVKISGVFAQTRDSTRLDSDHNIHPKITLPQSEKAKQKQTELKKKIFKTIEWLDLMPKKDLDSLLNPPEYIGKTGEGEYGDEIPSELRNLPKSIQDEYQRALTSTEIISGMNGKAIRIPGFIVPIEFDKEKRITQFFLVPYFGACIHLPPPPPNQIIFVTNNKGFLVKDIFEPVWISGILQTTHFENDIALSAYSMLMKNIEAYE